ncbi:MAG: two-CW domain-containing protein [Terriglobia bacterium]
MGSKHDQRENSEQGREKQNCWEFKKCGREPGGEKVDELGLCPACTDSSCDGINDGHNAGRICWAVAGTFCEGKVQGTFAQKKITCMSCDFYQKVFSEERSGSFRVLKPLQQAAKARK